MTFMRTLLCMAGQNRIILTFLAVNLENNTEYFIVPITETIFYLPDHLNTEHLFSSRVFFMFVFYFSAGKSLILNRTIGSG